MPSQDRRDPASVRAQPETNAEQHAVAPALMHAGDGCRYVERGTIQNRLALLHSNCRDRPPHLTAANPAEAGELSQRSKSWRSDHRASVLGAIMQQVVWRVTAKDGLLVTLQDHGWQHIVDSHPRMWPHRERIKEAVRDAHACRKVPGRKRLYYRAYHDLAKAQDGLLVAVVTNRQETRGYVASAYPCACPPWAKPKELG